MTNYPKVINDLRLASGAQKLAILRENNTATMRFILVYTYDPMRKYRIKKFPWSGKGVFTFNNSLSGSDLGPAELGTQNYEEYKDFLNNNVSLVYWLKKMLDRLSSGRLSGNRAKEVVKWYAEHLTPEYTELLKCIIKKDLRAGIGVKSINKALGTELIKEFGVKLAKTYCALTAPKTMYMSLKYDGVRGIYKDGQFYTRNGHVLKGLEHLTTVLLDQNCGPLDGELCIPGEHFQVASGQIRSDKPSSNVVYHVFDLPESTEPFFMRLQALSDWVPPENVLVVKHKLVTTQKTVDRNFAKALEAGYEGLVLKTPNHLYKPGRNADWLKMKATRSTELVILEVYEGEGKWEGMAGGCICGGTDTPGLARVRASSGRLSNADKQYVWDNQADYIGRPIEVLYHEETPTGSLRHPRMKSKHTRGDL